MKPTSITRTDLQSWRMAMEPFMSSVRVIKNTVNKFNDKGRPESIQECVDFRAVITPEGTTQRRNSSGHGYWTAESYKITYIYPDELVMEEIVISELYGKLKVIDIEDRREYGPSQATAIRLGSIRDLPDVGRNNVRRQL